MGCGNVGLPLSILLMQKNATVTMCHDKTKNLDKICKKSDIIITCVGKLGIITEHHVNENSIVIDVGINYNDKGKLEGDMPNELKKKVKMASPVPGGVGPMTIAMLMHNLVKKTMLEHELS